jgi:hypothetical protein
MKFVKIFGFTLLFLIGVAFAAPYLFKGKLLELAKNQINKNSTAKTDFSDLDISFFRSFPKVSIALENPQIVGTGEFALDTLFSAKKIDVAVDLMSIIKGSEYKIYNIDLEEPRIHAIVHKNGKTNWKISQPSSDTSSSSTKPFSMALRSYSIHHGYIEYKDEESNMAMEVVNLDHQGSGTFNSDEFVLTTKSSSDAISFRYGAFPFLANTKTIIDADLQVNNKTNTYSFKTDKVYLNDMKLNVEGFFQLMNDSMYKMDIAFNTPSSSFKNILSLVPSIYQKDFNSIQTTGEASLKGFVKGIYSSNQLPAYNLDVKINNGYFKYPDLPKPVKNINMSVVIDNPDGITDHTIVNIPNAHMELGQDPFDFRLLVKNPISNLYIDAGAKGKIDLSGVKQFAKLSADTKLDGIIEADLTAKGNVNALEKKQFNQFYASGNMKLDHFYYASTSYPDAIEIKQANASFNPKNVTVSNISGSYKKTHFDGAGSIDNLLPYMLSNKVLIGNFTVHADNLKVDDYMGTSTDTSTMQTGKSVPLSIPGNLDMKLNAKIDRVIYNKTNLDNVNGVLLIKDETISFNNIKTNALDGLVTVNGSYSTKMNKKNPDINLSYDVQDVDVQKTFYAFNTIQKIMPFGEFIDGKLNSHLTLSGKLNDKLMPDLNSLTGSGNLLLIKGILKKFAPVDKLASTLNVEQLKDVSLKDIKNYFEFANGKVLVKPFPVKVNNVEIEIGGLHGFDQSLDYTVNLKMPRNMMGNAGNNLVNNLVAQSNSKGIPIKVSDVVNLKVLVSGTIKNPLFKTDLKQTTSSLANDFKQQANELVKTEVESAKKSIKDSATSLKTQVLSSAKQELMGKLTGDKDTSHAKTDNLNDLKKKSEDIGKGLINGLFKKKPKSEGN